MDKQVVSTPRKEYPSFHQTGVIQRTFGTAVVNWFINRFTDRLPRPILGLGEALILSWWLLWLADLARPGLVSTVWNLNWLLLSGLILMGLGLILGGKTGRVNSLVALFSGILVALIIWQRLDNQLILLLAPVGGLLIFVLFKYKNHD